MKKFLVLILIFTLSFFSGNVTLAKAKSYKSSLEIRSIQTRYFDTTDTFKVMKAVVNTLQDNGFIIQNIEPDIGYIRAKKETRLKRTNGCRVAVYSTCLACDTLLTVLSYGLNVYNMYMDSMRLKNEIALHPVFFDTNVDIEVIGKRTKVRLTVIEKELENADGYTILKAAPRKVIRHYEQSLYQEFFNQLDKNIFIENI